MQHAIAVIRALDVAIHLGAQETVGEGMVRISRDTNRFPVLDRHEHRTRVRAIVRASASNDGGLRHVQSGLAVKQAFAIRVFPRLSQRKLRPNSLTLIPENLVYRTPEPRTSE